MEKIYYIFAGANGTGKTTLYDANRDKNLGMRINNDEILKQNGGDWKSQKDQVAAMLRSLELIRECLQKSISFNHETILTGDSYSFVKKIKDNGYKVYLHYVGVDSCDIVIKRVKEREKKGGHGVSETDIRRRYKESIENLKMVLPLCDRFYIYDNTEKFVRIAGGTDGKITEKYNSCKWFVV